MHHRTRGRRTRRARDRTRPPRARPSHATQVRFPPWNPRPGRNPSPSCSKPMTPSPPSSSPRTARCSSGCARTPGSPARPWRCSSSRLRSSITIAMRSQPLRPSNVRSQRYMHRSACSSHRTGTCARTTCVSSVPRPTPPEPESSRFVPASRTPRASRNHCRCCVSRCRIVLATALPHAMSRRAFICRAPCLRPPTSRAASASMPRWASSIRASTPWGSRSTLVCRRAAAA